MKFFNTTGRSRVKRTESPDDPMSIVKFEDVRTDSGVDVSFVLDAASRTLRVVDTKLVTKSGVVLDFNDYPDEDPVWILTRKIGFLRKHNARMRIAVFGDCFLVILYAGQILPIRGLGLKRSIAQVTALMTPTSTLLTPVCSSTLPIPYRTTSIRTRVITVSSTSSIHTMRARV